jgi:uncharacterized protein YjbI with pentapeptide repeats
MKAVEVIEQYKSGRRDFRSQSLRGCNFKNQDLSGADFSGCDIRGANFSRANLTEVKFEKAKAGLRKRSVVISLMVAILLISLAIFVLSWYAYLVQIIPTPQYSRLGLLSVIASLSVIPLPFCVFAWRQNILAGVIALVVIGLIIAIIMAISTANNVFSFFINTLVAAGLVYIFVALFIAIAIIGICVGIMIGALIGLKGIVLIEALAFILPLVLALFFNSNGAFLNPSSAFIVIAFSGVLTLFFVLLGWLTLKKENRDLLLRKFAITFSMLAGTSFFKANLNATDFTRATLKSTNFNQAIMNKTIFKQAIKLELARPGKTLLINPHVRELLINPSKGTDQDLTKADLRGANLDGANLQRTNLRLADLSQASFRYANLREANLTEVNAVNADLSHATLTGACVENWNIDATTQLDNIDCQYVYLLNNQKERRPSSGEFEPGEFTQLFEEVFDTVDLIFRDGMDWKALMNTLKEVQVQNEDTPLQVQAIENKGNGVFIVKVHVPPDTNKEKIHQEFTEIYQIKAQLAAQDEQLKFLREQNTDLTQIIKIQAQNQAKVEISYNKHDHSQTINVGQDFTIEAKDSTVNLRDTGRFPPTPS